LSQVTDTDLSQVSGDQLGSKWNPGVRRRLIKSPAN
jgi:hypothetical protein